MNEVSSETLRSLPASLAPLVAQPRRWPYPAWGGRPLTSVLATLVVLGAVSLAPGTARGGDLEGRRPRGSASARVHHIAESLAVNSKSYRFEDHPQLLERILSTPHAYFRFTNTPFRRWVCKHLADFMAEAPVVNLHGDAHLEQYAATNEGRGLTDFDNASMGPGALDLLRFGVSIHLALGAYSPSQDSEAAFDTFLRGYRQALRDPTLEAPEPRWVAGVRRTFSGDRRALLSSLGRLTAAVGARRRTQLISSLQGYVELMQSKTPDLPAWFFDVRRVGLLRMGIGSALQEKYLLQVEGATTQSEDDVILEVKAVGDPPGDGCTLSSRRSDPFPILVGSSHIAYSPNPFLGYLDIEQRSFWVHSWSDHYVELPLEEVIREGLFEEVIFDAGVQLGRGHPRFASDFAADLRRAQIRFLDRNEATLRSLVPVLGEATVLAHHRFRKSVEAGFDVDPSRTH